MNQYELTKSNRYGYGSVFAPIYPSAKSVSTLAEPTGRFGCLVYGTRPDPATIEETYCTIYYLSNKKANAAFPTPMTESYKYADIADVFNAYIEGVRNGECPEYTKFYDNDTPVNKAPVDYKAAVKYIVKRVPQLNKYTDPSAFVRTMFWHAIDSYKRDAKSIRPDVLWPLTVDSRDAGNPYVNEWFGKREEAVKEAQDDKGPLDKVNDLLSNVLMLAVVGTALYLLAPLIFSRK